MRAGITLLSVVLLSACGGNLPAFEQPVHSPAALIEHGREFEKGVVRVADRVYVAIGFGLANSIMVEGDDGIIVIDTMETVENGQAVRAAFREVVDKPVKAIIYTHNHTDHVFGAEAFRDPGTQPRVFAHATTMDRVYQVVTEFRPVITRRSLRMFGTPLNDEQATNNGIGPFLGVGPDSTLGVLSPTETFVDELEAEVAGVRFRLVHAPGETDDQVFVWFPDLQVLAPGDNIYKAFPNLYTIRGTPYRSLKAWADSLDKMRALPVKHLVPSHTRPLSGQDEVHRALTDYRDAIRFVYDQTVRAMNRGMTPDEAAEAIKLPPHLARSPYLQEFYGTVEWSVRSVFAGNLGWFDGNPANLQPLPPKREAQKMAELAGGESALRRAVLNASERGDHQWALRLSDHALRLNPGDDAVRQARIQSLIALGEAASNPNARHYYLTSAKELQGFRIELIQNASSEMLRNLPLSRFFAAIPANLDAKAALDVDRKTGISFPDSGEAYTIWIRHGVAEIRPGLMPDVDLHVAIDSLVWKEMLAGFRSPAITIAKDVEYRKGGPIGFARFMGLFQPEQ